LTTRLRQPFRQEGLCHHLHPMQQLESLCQHVRHQRCNDLPTSSSSKGHINSFATKFYNTFIGGPSPARSSSGDLLRTGHHR
jgi:hypothetical protein